MIGPYWKMFGGLVRLDQIMDAAGASYQDLPRLSKHAGANGRNKLCWAGVLGHCSRQNCVFIHEKGEDLLNDIVKETCRKLDMGVCWVVNTQSARSNGPLVGANGGVQDEDLAREEATEAAKKVKADTEAVTATVTFANASSEATTGVPQRVSTL